jgi:hypothetical protein
MTLTIEDFLDPLARNSVSHNKGIIITAYEHRYFRIKDRIKWAVCKYNEKYVAHFRIPSESLYCKDVYYDTIFELSPVSKGDIESTSLRNYSVKIFSNYITFIFSFTYAYNKAGLLIPWLLSKCTPQCLNTPAYIKNKQNTIAPDIKTWFASQHFKRLNLLSKQIFEGSINTSVQHIAKYTMHQTTMFKLRTITERNEKARLRKDKQERVKKEMNNNRNLKNLKGNIIKEVNNHNAKTGASVNAHITSNKIIKSIRKARVARTSRKPKKSR